ncbi:alpha/beta hydrolases superfamily protein [Tanacetum coccineum]
MLFPCQKCGNREKITPTNIKHHIHNNGFSRGYPTWVYHGEPRIISPPVVDDTNMINVLNNIRRENNYIELETNTHTEHNTEHNTNTASTSNEPPEATGPTKDDMEGLFEMANEELFPDVVHDSNSSDVALTDSLDDLEYTWLSGVGHQWKSSTLLFGNCLLFGSGKSASSHRGHGGDNGPSNDDRLWEPPSIHKNAKGRKKGFDAKLIKKFEDGEKKKLPIKFDFKDLRTTKPIGLNRRDFTGLIGNEIEQ